jgi:membrane protein required for colicin V production
MQDLVWFDIITLALIVLLGIKGVINGFIKEVFGLVGLVGGVYVASRYAQDAGIWIDKTFYAFDNKASLFLVGFIGLLICFWLGSLLVGKIIAKLIDISGLSGIDKLAGFLIGSSKIFFVFSIFFVAISNITFIQTKIETYLSESFMYPIFMDVGEKIINLKPDEVIPQTKEEVMPQPKEEVMPQAKEEVVPQAKKSEDEVTLDNNQSDLQRSPNED